MSRREEQIEALQARLAGAVEALVTGDDWRRAIEFAARFRSRSWRNTLPIYEQHELAHELGLVDAPAPTYVAGYQQWKTLGRHVRKGQPGYQILAPVTRRVASATPKDPNSWRRLGRGEQPGPGEVVRPQMFGVRCAHVWDVSQTVGRPLPEHAQPKLLQGEAPPGLWDELVDESIRRGYQVRRVDSAADIAGANGLTDFDARLVSVRRDVDDAAQVKTLAHELGHVIMHGPENPDAVTHRGIAEVEAESFALMVGAAHGMATDEYTVPYVSSWASTVADTTPAEVVQETGERVRKAAVDVLDRLKIPQVQDGTPPADTGGVEPVVTPAQPSRTVHERRRPPSLTPPTDFGVAP